MRLTRRVATLVGRLPGPRPKGVPTGPAELLAGRRDGTVRMEEMVRRSAKAPLQQAGGAGRGADTAPNDPGLHRLRSQDASKGRE